MGWCETCRNHCHHLADRTDDISCSSLQVQRRRPPCGRLGLKVSNYAIYQKNGATAGGILIPLKVAGIPPMVASPCSGGGECFLQCTQPSTRQIYQTIISSTPAPPTRHYVHYKVYYGVIHMQGSRICGTFSDPELTQNHFLRTRMFRFSRQKCRILTFRDKNFIF